MSPTSPDVKGPSSAAALVLSIAMAAGTAAAQSTLHNNGPFVSHPAGGAGGADLSSVQVPLQCQSYGISIQASPANDRAADDFVLTGAATITSVVLYAFQRNSTTTASTFTHVNLRIWSGRPDDPGSVVLFGNTTTNRLSAATWTGCYRARSDDLFNTERPIFAVEAAIEPPLNLPAGTYWLDWQAAGTLSGGPQSALVVVPGQQGAPNANARSKLGSAPNWVDYRDSGNNVRQELAFLIRGTLGGGPAPCYANCDGSTSNPILSANDFQCFLNQYVAGVSYANCDGSTSMPVLSANDFQCFLNRYVAGCS